MDTDVGTVDLPGLRGRADSSALPRPREPQEAHSTPGTPPAVNVPAPPALATDTPSSPSSARDTQTSPPSARDSQASCSPAVAQLAEAVEALVRERVLPVGLSAGDRPFGDVTALLSAVARVEAVLAMRLAAAEDAGALPFVSTGGAVSRAYWSRTRAKALSRAGRLANERPDIAQAWLTGDVVSEHVDTAARGTTGLAPQSASAVLDGLSPLWGQVTPAAIATYCARARIIVEPDDGQADERAQRAHDARFLSFSTLSDTMHITGSLPRLEGEMLVNTLNATAERTRVAGDGLTRAQRRADALVQLAAARPTEASGVPSANISVTLTAGLGAVTESGWPLTGPETRFVMCDPAVTPVLTDMSDAGAGRGDRAIARAGGDPSSSGVANLGGEARAGGDPSTSGEAWVGRVPGPGDKLRWASGPLAALTAQALNAPQPLALGRTQRVASAGQRRALAVRDGGCIMPGCEVTAPNCQIHHLTPWTHGGDTDLPNLVSLCWAHHRQVDLGRWEIHPATADPPIPGCTPASNGAPFTIAVRPRRQWRREPGG